jgi:hypothetical protein
LGPGGGFLPPLAGSPIQKHLLDGNASGRGASFDSNNNGYASDNNYMNSATSVSFKTVHEFMNKNAEPVRNKILKDSFNLV